MPHNLADDVVHVAVAGADDLEIEVAAAGRGFPANVVCHCPHGCGYADQIVRWLVQRQQDPCRPRARRLVAERHLACRRLGHRIDSRARLGGHRNRQRHPPRCVDGGRQGRPERVESSSRACNRRHHRRAKPRRQPRHVDLDALLLRLVDHVQRDDDAGTSLEHLVDEVQVPPERGGIDDDQDGVGPSAAAPEHRVDGDLFVARSCAEAVGAGKIDELSRAETRKVERASGAGDGDAGIVADFDVGAGERVEERRLARIRVAGNQNDRPGASGRRRRDSGGGRPAWPHCHASGSSTSMESASARRIDRA